MFFSLFQFHIFLHPQDVYLNYNLKSKRVKVEISCRARNVKIKFSEHFSPSDITEKKYSFLCGEKKNISRKALMCLQGYISGTE